MWGGGEEINRAAEPAEEREELGGDVIQEYKRYNCFFAFQR